jgi:hypothetical protein
MVFSDKETFEDGLDFLGAHVDKLVLEDLVRGLHGFG